MSKIYTVTYTDNPDLPRARPPIRIPFGSFRCEAIKYPSEARITRFLVKQTSGPSVPFSIELLDSKLPYSPGDHPLGELPEDDVALYRVIDRHEGLAGEELVAANEEFGFSYLNQDGSFSRNQRLIYLVITPDTAGSSSSSSSADDATEWDVVIRGYTEVG